MITANSSPTRRWEAEPEGDLASALRRDKVRWVLAKWLGALGVLCAASAWGHDADVVSVEVRSHGEDLEEIVRMTSQTLARLAPLVPDDDLPALQATLDRKRVALEAGVWADMPLGSLVGPCVRRGERASALPGVVELRAAFRCPSGELHQEFRFLAVLPANYQIVVDDEGALHYAKGALTTVVLSRPQRRSSGFSTGFTAGLRRACSLDALSALVALGLCLASRRRAVATLAMLLVAGAITSSLDAPPLLAAALLATSSLALAILKVDRWLVLSLTVGLGVGLKGAGGGLSVALGFTAGSALACLFLIPLAAAGGGPLSHRGWLGAVLWGLAAVGALSAGLGLVG